MARTISNTDDVIDSRDVIARIEELEAEREVLDDVVDTASDAVDEAQAAVEDIEDEDSDEFQTASDALIEAQDELVAAKEALIEWEEDSDLGGELVVLKKLADDAESSPDWIHGETLIRDDYFVEHTEQLIDECWDMPKEMNSGDWPWRHIKIDYDAAAEELKADYFEVDYDGVSYWIRA